MTDSIKFLFNDNVSTMITIKKLSGGLSNDIYLINSKYIWKVFKNKYLFDHKIEKEIIKKSGDYFLYYFDDNNICYNYIPGNNIDLNFFNKNIKDIIDLTKKYHSIRIENKEHFWIDILPYWIQLLPDEVAFIKKSSIEKLYLEINKQLEELNTTRDLVLCHHDIHSGNIINNNNKLHLIDLEFSFYDYYFVDIGNIICELYTDYNKEEYNYNLIDDNDIIKMLIYYQKRIEKVNLEKVRIGIKISHLYWCVWGLLVGLKEEDSKFNYFKFAKIRYNTLKASLNQIQFH